MKENNLLLIGKIKKIRKVEKVNFKCHKFKMKNVYSDQSITDINLETQQPQKLDMKKVCKYTGLKYGTCYDKLKSNNINYCKIGRKPIFNIKDISEFILQHKAGNWSKVSFSEEEIIYGEKVDIKECSKLTGLCYNTFYTHMNKENLPHIKYDNKAVFLKDFIEEWAESNGQKYRK